MLHHSWFNKFYSTVIHSLFVGGIFCTAANALAQPALEEVLVTAQLREQNNQTIGSAVTAINKDQLQAADFTSVVDLGPEVPGLVVTTYNTANPQYFIRGIGSTGTSAGEDPSVSVFIDGVYAGRSGNTAIEFYDLERVEVLRGPQGTLFGRNAAGGLIQIISQKPVFDNAGYLVTSIGSHREYGIGGALNAVLAGDNSENSLLSRLSFLYQQHDGYVTNTLTGSDSLRESEDVSARWHLLKTFSAQTLALLWFNYAESEQTGMAARKAETLNNPLIVAGFIPLPQPVADIDSVTLSSDGPTNRKSLGINLMLQHDFDNLRFESITALSNHQYDVLEDVSAVGLIELSQDEKTSQFTQEFRLLSNEKSLMEWTVGFYYLQENIERLDVTDVSAVTDLASLALPFTLPDEIANYDQKADNTSVALYGQTSVPLNDRISFIVGGRYTRDAKQLSLNATGADPLLFGILPLGSFSGRVDKDFDNFSAHLGLHYFTADNVLLYGQFSQGYKAGGFDGNSATLISLNQAFAEEIANTVEFGLKAQWWQNRARTNIAVFYTDYQDLQVFQVTNTGLQFVDNAAAATVQGVEFESDLLFSQQLQTNLSCAFLDSEYDEFISAVDDNNDTFPDDLQGNTLTRSPKTACSVALEYRPIIRGDQPLQLRLSYAYQDDVFITPQNRPFDTIEAFNLVNFSARYRIGPALSVSVFAKNLTDEKYRLHTYDADPLTRHNLRSSIYAEPRMWKASLRFDF